VTLSRGTHGESLDRGERVMNPNIRIFLCSALSAGAFLMAASAGGQQTQQKLQSSAPDMRAYDMARETVLQGTVTQYIASSTVPPLGAHVILHTSSGSTDVHVGSDKFLQTNKLTLSTGDAVRIVGEEVAYGDSSIFVARTIQKGAQTLTVRSARGFPLSSGAARTPAVKVAAHAGGAQ
jgi:hypothetical protein